MSRSCLFAPLALALLALFTPDLFAAESAPAALSESTDEAKLEAEQSRLYAEGRYAAAKPPAAALVVLREKKYGSGNARYAAALRSLGAIELGRGDSVAAAAPARRAVEILEKAPGEEAELAEALAVWGDVLAARGERPKAEKAYERAIKLDEKAGEAREVRLGVWLDKLASLYVSVIRDGVETMSASQKRATIARKLASRALEIHERRADERALLQSLTLQCELFRADAKVAKPCYERALPLADKLLGKEHPDRARLLANAARYEASARNAPGADALFREAEAIFKASLGADHPELGQLYSDWAMARLSADVQDHVRAFELREMADKIEEATLEKVLQSGTETEKLAYARKFERGIDRAVSLQLLAPGKKEATRIALQTILRRKGRVLDVMTGSVLSLRSHSDPEAKALASELVAARSALSTAVVAGPRGQTIEQYEEELARLGARADAVETRVSAFSAAHRKAASAPITIEAVQSMLPEDGALLEFHRYTVEHPFFGSLYHERSVSQYMLYILRKHGEPYKVFIPTSAELIDGIVERMRQGIQDAENTRVMTELGQLEGLYFRHNSRQLEGVRQLFISPDGALNLVPFGALRDMSLHFLLEKYTITYLSSGRDLLPRTEHVSPRTAPLILANPDYNASPAPPRSVNLDLLPVLARVRFPPIEGTGQEAEAIAHLLPGPTVRISTEATETALRGATGPKVLHVATHGFFLDESGRLAIGKKRALVLEGGPAKPPKSSGKKKDEDEGPKLPPIENPLFLSGIALAGANGRHGQPDDGILTAYEAGALDLRGTELVVLSACETGVGAVDAGEGVFGLRRALVMAGAETQVMSLWQVDDAATRDLMTSYYENLFRRGLGRSEAMRQAQLAMLKQNERKHPFYWASFIVSGAFGPVEGGGKDEKAAGALPPGGAKGCGCEVVGGEPSEKNLAAVLGIFVLAVGGARRRQKMRRPAVTPGQPRISLSVCPASDDVS